MSAGAAVATPVEIEIIDLHRFFVQWFSGACEDSDHLFEQRLVSRFASDFQIITPGGALLEGAALWSAMRSAWGSNPGFKIEIRDVCERRVSTTRLVIASYEEWQKNALESTLRTMLGCRALCSNSMIARRTACAGCTCTRPGCRRIGSAPIRSRSEDPPCASPAPGKLPAKTVRAWLHAGSEQRYRAPICRRELSALCEGFRTPAMTSSSTADAAGVRKAPMNEIAEKGTYQFRQPTQFEFAINAWTVKSLGLKISLRFFILLSMMWSNRMLFAVARDVANGP
jgi:hypothetical protein